MRNMMLKSRVVLIVTGVGLLLTGCTSERPPEPSDTFTVGTPVITPSVTPEPVPGVETSTPPTTASTDGGAATAGVGGRRPTDEDLNGIPNPGQKVGESIPPASGPTIEELTIAKENAEKFLSTYWSYGAGDTNAWDSTIAAMVFASPTYASQLQTNADNQKNGVTSSRPWQEQVNTGKRYQCTPYDVWWADWSHKDYAVAGLWMMCASLEPGSSTYPPFAQPRWRYLTLTRESGWKVDSWSDTAPVGFIIPDLEW